MGRAIFAWVYFTICSLSREVTISHVNILLCICVYSWVCIFLSLQTTKGHCEVSKEMCLCGPATELRICFKEKCSLVPFVQTKVQLF